MQPQTEQLITRNYSQASSEFLRHCQIKGLSSHTVAYYVKELKQNGRALADIDAPLNDIRLLTADHIEGFVVNQQELGRAVSTINSRLRAGHTFFVYCLRKGYVDHNPYAGVSKLKERHKIGATLTKKQLKRLLSAPDVTTFTGLRDLTIMLSFTQIGCRLAELAALRVQDVSFDGKGAVSIQEAKNRYARRIPLTKQLRAVLKTYIEERGALDTDSLFVSLDNRPFSARSIQERLAFYGDKSGVSREVNVSPHVFRRTFCRLKVEAGTNIFVLQRLTGHNSLEVLRRYVQIYGKDLEEAVEMGFEDM
ncbi:tyrosine-type recombinase/integrase [Bacillus sp. JJ722]|uniref:tyrosine-type recombinase/integrase n=1 Tax=Bacillus sp. JJ722 TaxID=3122973 RepID=UPI002FFEFF23